MENDPSPEQRAVINAEHPKFVVTASAGAGKTSVLVERYLRHVQQEKLRPDQILTITFTKKAAVQMKKRIVRTLREHEMTEQAQIAETGPIQTIHSFCERLLRENALEAGLDPAYDILTEAQSSRVALECIRAALSSDLSESPEAEKLIAYLAGRRQNPRESRSPYSALENGIYEVLQEFRSCGIDYETLRDRHRDTERLEAFWNERLIGVLSEDVREALTFAEGGSLQERIQKTCKELGHRQPIWVRGKYDAEAEQESLSHSVGLVHLACEAWTLMYAEMNRLQALDFSELESRAVRLLANSEPTRLRVREQYRVAMVDEAQDLNPTQYRLLELLGIEREMLVGDPQQSIYGFRQTDVDLFHRHVERNEELKLKKNYRSGEGILTFVDMLFRRLWKTYDPMSAPEKFDLDKVISIDCTGVELWRQQASDTAVTAATIKELVEEGVCPGHIAVLVRHAAYAIDLKARLDALKIESRIAGGSERFYARLEVRDLANALRAVADPYDDFSLLACLRSPVVGLSLDSIILLGKEPRVVERLEEFEPPVPDDRARLMAFLSWYLPLKGIGDRLSAWEVLSDIYAHSYYLQALARRPDGDQQLANVRKLLALAAQEPELGPLEYAERIREIQDIRHREGDAPAGDENEKVVTLMTIHKSKGLEFPVVVVPQTDRRLEGRTKDLAIDSRVGLVATKFGKVPAMMHRYLSELKKLREEEEELRVLYVALTRAKTRLCVCLYPTRGHKTISKIISDAVGQVPPPGVIVREQEAEPTPT
ncbi:MAG: UvrD-helicase domain-containing protein [Fimbriimonas sp.]